jgi:hypothetical protein
MARSASWDALFAAQESLRVRAERAAAAEQARVEAEIRAELTERVKRGIAAVLDGHPGVDKARREEIYGTAAEAAVGALAEFYAEGTAAIWEASRR